MHAILSSFLCQLILSLTLLLSGAWGALALYHQDPEFSRAIRRGVPGMETEGGP